MNPGLIRNLEKTYAHKRNVLQVLPSRSGKPVRVPSAATRFFKFDQVKHVRTHIHAIKQN